MTPVRDQAACGGCWAFAISEVIGDRLGALGCSRGVMSPQDLISCDSLDAGCNGGNFDTAWDWVTENGITTDECITFKSTKGKVPQCPE
ncbi:MAG: putative cathepsin B2 cysteine protease, partial [Streblomastix strix]